MLAQTQSVLSKSMSSVTSSGSVVKAFIGSHPVVFGTVVGIGAYYAVSKCWLNKDKTEESASATVDETGTADVDMTQNTESS